MLSADRHELAAPGAAGRSSASVSFQLAYHVPDVPNAGDAANALLWPKLMGIEFAGESVSALLGIGSILTERFNGFARTFVVGSGARGPDSVPKGKGWRFFAVRGPLTAAAFGLDPALAVSDPGILVPEAYDIGPRQPSHRFGLVSYFRTDPLLAAALAEDVGMLSISTRDDVATMLAAIAGCEVVFTESLHGAIFADALRVPWVPILGTNGAFEGATSSFKWRDWCGAMNLDFDPVALRPMPMRSHRSVAARLKDIAALYRNRRTLRRALGSARPSLSTGPILADRTERLREAALLARGAMLRDCLG